MTAARSDTFQQAYERLDLPKVKTAHIKLVEAYVTALEGASQVASSWKRPTNSGFESGLLIRWMIGSHIRRNLMDLANIYLQLEQTFIGDDSDPLDPWLPKVREGCLATAERLPRLRLPGIISLLSAVAVLTGLLSKLPGWAGDTFLVITFAVSFSIWLPFVTMTSSYRYKRSLFFLNAGQADKEKFEDQKVFCKNNAYALEDDLYRILRRGKKRETELDKLASGLAIALLSYAALGFMWWYTDLQNASPIPFIIILSIGTTAILLNLWLASKRRRLWL